MIIYKQYHHSIDAFDAMRILCMGWGTRERLNGQQFDKIASIVVGRREGQQEVSHRQPWSCLFTFLPSYLFAILVFRLSSIFPFCHHVALPFCRFAAFLSSWKLAEINMGLVISRNDIISVAQLMQVSTTTQTTLFDDRHCHTLTQRRIVNTNASQ